MVCNGRIYYEMTNFVCVEWKRNIASNSQTNFKLSEKGATYNAYNALHVYYCLAYTITKVSLRSFLLRVDLGWDPGEGYIKVVASVPTCRYMYRHQIKSRLPVLTALLG